MYPVNFYPMKLPVLAALTACALALTGCLSNNANTCSQTLTAPASTVAGPKTVAVNQPATFLINYPIESPCGKSNGALEQVIGTTRYVGVQVVYDGCNCPLLTSQSQTSYTFTPTQVGTYFLKFSSGTNAYITDTLVVQ